MVEGVNVTKVTVYSDATTHTGYGPGASFYAKILPGTPGGRGALCRIALNLV